MDDQLSQSERGPVRIVATCDDCGNEFDGKAVRMIEAFSRSKIPHLCPECVAKQSRLLDMQEREAQEQRLAYWRSEWLRTCGMPFTYQDKTFENFDPIRNEQRVELVREWADGFPQDAPPVGYPSLLIAARNNGVGKTHLACAALRRVIGRFNNLGFEKSPVRFYVANEVKNRLEDAKRFSSKETVTDVHRELATVRLLLLDDMGKEKATGADAATTYEMYYTIINGRYSNGLPMLITSNLGFDPWENGAPSLVDLIGQAGVSRLREMTQARQIVVVGDDRR